MAYKYKIVVLLMLMLLVVLTAANVYLGLGVFPRFAKLMLILSVLAGLVFVTRFAPRREEIKEHRRRRKERRQ